MDGTSELQPVYVTTKTAGNRVQLGQEERRHQVLSEAKYVQRARYGLAQRRFYINFPMESACVVSRRLAGDKLRGLTLPPPSGGSDSVNGLAEVNFGPFTPAWLPCRLLARRCARLHLYKNELLRVRNVVSRRTDRSQKGRVQKGRYEPLYRRFALFRSERLFLQTNVDCPVFARTSSVRAGPYLPFGHPVSKTIADPYLVCFHVKPYFVHARRTECFGRGDVCYRFNGNFLFIQRSRSLLVGHD